MLSVEITFSTFTEHTSPIFKSLIIVKFFDIVKLITSVFMYKFHRILLPSIFSNFFTPVRNVHSYNTRLASKSSFALPSARTNYRIFSLKFRPKAQKKLGILSTSHSNLVASCVPACLTDPIITPFNYITLNYKVVQLRQALMVFLDVLYLSLFYNSERFEPRCGNVVV